MDTNKELSLEEIDTQLKQQDKIVSEIVNEFFARGGYISQRDLHEISKRVHLRHGIDLDELTYEPAESLP